MTTSNCCGVFKKVLNDSPDAFEQFKPLKRTLDGIFNVNMENVNGIFSTRDKKMEFISFNGSVLTHIPSSMGYPAYYPLKPAKIKKTIKAVLIRSRGKS